MNVSRLILIKFLRFHKINELVNYCTISDKRLPNKIGFIGDGAMAKAICKSIQKKGLIDYAQVSVSSPFPKNLDSWKALGAKVYTDNSIVAKECDVVFLAVKPHMLQDVLEDMSKHPLASEIKNKLFVSILAGISIKDLEEVYLFIEALSDGGVRMGLHRDMATRFAAQTVMGAAKMVLETNKHMGTLKDEVCSAGGQTIAGIHALERGGVRGSVMDAIEAAALRAAELGKQSKK